MRTTKLWRNLPCLIVLACSLLLGAGCSKSAKAKRLLASAERDYQAQQYDAAELKFRGVLRLSYLNPAAIQRLGLLYSLEGRPSQAAGFLKKSLELNPNDLEVEMKMAQVLASLGNAKAAFTLSSRVLEKEPGNVDALLLCVDLARNVTNLNIVRAQIEKMQTTGTDAAPYHLGLGWIDLRLQQANDAEAELQKALKLDPKLPGAYTALAALASERKDMQSTSNYLRTAADLSPVRSNARLTYAGFLLQTGAAADGEKALQDITRQAPDYIPAWKNLMEMYFGEKKYEECSEVIAKILARDASNFDALMESGNIYISKRDGTNALEMFKRVELVPLYTKVPIVKYQIALAELMNGDRVSAVGKLTETLTLDTNYEPAIYLLADLDMQGGNSAAAIKLLAPVAKKEPRDFRNHLLLATAYMTEHQPDNALEIYTQMETVFTKSPELPRLIGLVYEREGKFAEARTAFEQSLALEPDYLPTLERITDLDVAGKRFEDAENRLKATIGRNPTMADPWLYQGRVYQAAGQTNQAESAYSKAIELNPSLPGAYLSLARLYMETHQEQQALSRLTALVSKTNDVTALQELGEIYQQTKKYDEARDAFEKLITFQPDSAPALNNLAYLYSQHYGNLEKAAQLAERARKARPDDSNIADTLGWILYKQGQYPRALGLIRESLDKQPNTPEIHMHIGMIYYKIEEEDLARVHLQQALSTDVDYPDKEEARQCLALVSIDPGTATPAAVELLENRLRDHPGDPVPLSRIAAIQELHGENDKAAETYQKLIAQNPQNWKAMIKLGRLYSGPLHQTRKALDIAKSAHELAPGDARASAMLGELVYDSGDYSWALSLLEDAVPKLTNQPVAQYDLALANYAVGRVANADTAMETAIEAGASLPNLDQAKQFQAFRAAAKDPAGSAIPEAQVQAALEKDPHYLPALALSGILAERQGDAAKAAKTFEQILVDYPKFTPAMRELALIYGKQSGNETKAYDYGEKARAAFPDDLELARTVGIQAYKKGDFQRSILILRQSSQNFDGDGELCYYLGLDYNQLKQTKESKKYLQQALDLNVPSPMSDDAKRVLAELK